ncbi:MAG: HEAT repeat domain-containing protein, partial [Acidobacteriota bacterium]
MSHAKSNVESTTVSNPLFRVACLGALLLLVGSGPLLANGWFYHSIPYEALIRGLDSESPDYRSMAAMALGMRRESRAVPKLLQGLEAQGERLQVKIEIFRALGWIGDPATEPVLLQGLREAAPELRAEAADALAQLAPPEALSPLLQAFEREQDLIVRTRLVAALGSYEQPAAIASLVRVLEDGESSTLRVHATRALGHAGVATSA